MRVTWTTMIARRASGASGSAKPSAEQLVEPRVARAARPRRGRAGAGSAAGPSKAQNITQMRPFSRRWAIVSAPLPTMSR